ncbi:nucleoside 2-deoxyribosyltransferase [Bacillus cereus]|uniref:nucleoside 2-deoxyribosyltransferase n=1 Tax=Bacillus cereus TaxID=1396 RepID=UPI000E6C9205|nr:nucleoside 2-deoxyribosyltransferase [Bacillus cereus]RJE13266.1 hypothetical protein C0U42_16385 [Bacillus cereus]
MKQVVSHVICSDIENYHKISMLLHNNDIQINYNNEALMTSGVINTTMIEECDFVIAVITEGNPTTFYELGYAQGLGKPIFLVVNKKINLPLKLQGIVYTFAIDGNFLDDKYINGMNFSLQQFLDNYPMDKKHIKKKKKVSKIPKNILTQEKDFLQRTYDLRDNNNLDISSRGMLFEEIVADLFMDLNLGAIVRNEIKEGKEIDFALWVDEVEEELGNPILVELKLGNLSRNILEKAEFQLRKHISSSNANTGLIIYLDNCSRKFEQNKKADFYNIFYLELTDLIKSLEEKTFAEILIELKNQFLFEKGGK